MCVCVRFFLRFYQTPFCTHGMSGLREEIVFHSNYGVKQCSAVFFSLQPQLFFPLFSLSIDSKQPQYDQNTMSICLHGFNAYWYSSQHLDTKANTFIYGITRLHAKYDNHDRNAQYSHSYVLMYVHILMVMWAQGAQRALFFFAKANRYFQQHSNRCDNWIWNINKKLFVSLLLMCWKIKQIFCTTLFAEMEIYLFIFFQLVKK